jgi:hypothetical protein
MLLAPAIAPIPQILFFGLCTLAFSSLSHNPAQNLQQYSRRSGIGGNQVKFWNHNRKKTKQTEKTKKPANKSEEIPNDWEKTDANLPNVDRWVQAFPTVQ